MSTRPFHANHSPFLETGTDDPLAQALRPPPDESPDERARREQEAREASRISHEIDENIQESRKAFERRKRAIKILLLGQAESGKSTTLKNFQLAFSPQHFRSEKLAWKTIIQLNLIRSIKQLLEVLEQEWTEGQTAPKVVTSTNGATIRFSTSPLTDTHRRIRLRLLPLLDIEEELTKKLFPEINGFKVPDKVSDGTAFPPGIKEVCVRAGSGWKGVLSSLIGDDDTDKNNRPNTAEDKNNPTTMLAMCRDDIVALWEDPIVQGVLKKRGVRLQDMPGFFLNDAARIATLNYEPTDDDIVRARLRTLGVEEHRFTMENGAYPGSEWYIYDVGGSRYMRPHWIPYFDDVQAIIFLAPLAFNLMLEEDPKVNRLEDSISLWREICKNPLLAKTTLILFLNKMDILQATLAAGIRVQKYVPSYGDQPNDVQHVVKYFRDKFRGYHKRLSPSNRPFYWHETSVVDTKATSVILIGVREGILRAHLQSVNVI
ncbi:G-protein alpha subunit [Panus rudis PR-1116 ss-1]|nr:G-protein alpha subunit [Panus rudis PR-1116 ss-1]